MWTKWERMREGTKKPNRRPEHCREKKWMRSMGLAEIQDLCGCSNINQQYILMT
jgi:hypothetical protein